MVVVLLLVGVCLWTPSLPAQTESPFSIRVEAPEVVVPVVVLDRTHRVAAAGSYAELDEEITDLAVKDFHVYEDGVEEAVDDVTMELPRIRDVRDNISHHIEDSFTPRGTWSSPELWPQEDGVRLSPLALSGFLRAAGIVAGIVPSHPSARETAARDGIFAG